MIFFILGGCSSGEISPDDIKNIRVEPSELVISTSPGVPNTEEFIAYATLKNDDEIIMDLISWESSNLSAGSIDTEGIFTTVDTNGGVTNVVASHFGVEGTATVKVIYTDDILADDVSAEVIDAFASAGKNEDPDIGFLYPNDGVNLPRNLDGLGFLWLDPSSASSTVYRLRFQTEITDISVYTDNNRWLSSSDLWVLISAANRDGTVEAYVQAGEWNGSSLSNVRQSPPISLMVNRLDARGSVLYWAGNTQAIMRIPFGEVETNLFWGTDTTNGGCVGCHSLADDAERLVVTHHGVNGRFSILNIEDPLNPVELIGANDFNKATFKTISPDGQYMLGFNECRDSQDGYTCGQIPQGQQPPSSRVTLYEIDSGLPITYWDFESKLSSTLR